MAAQYHSLFTTQGLALLREAIQTGAKLGITHMAYGDGNGIVPTPNADFTKLVREVYRTPLNRLSPSKENSNWLEADGVIPSAVGGFNIREVGLYAGNVLVAYANYPATYKPSSDQGTAQIKTIRIVLQIDNTANFELKIDASVVMATIQSVEDAKNEVIHLIDQNYYSDEGSSKIGFKARGLGAIFRSLYNKLLNRIDIEDYGASPTASPETNANAINNALRENLSVFVPSKDYQIAPDIIQLKSNNRLYGKGRLIGVDPDTKMVADGSGKYITISNSANVSIEKISLKNGYKGIGLYIVGSSNLEFDTMTIDGFTYGAWVGENDIGNGCQNIIFNKPKILNTRYWGIYCRGLGIIDETLKTQKIKVLNPYFYNANMAAFVAAEGNVKYISLINPVFERCNIPMHFELASDYEVINPRDIDTGKKPDHVQANTEYPFENWSLYQCFTNDAKITGGTLENHCYHLASKGGESKNTHYNGTEAKTWVFEGAGSEIDADKNFFENFSWSDCTSKKEFIYHQETDAGQSYLKNFKVKNSECLLIGSGNGQAVSINTKRSIDLQIIDNTFHDSCFRIKCSGQLKIKDNTILIGTDNTINILDGTSGDLSGNFLDFSGNIFSRAGGVVFGESAFLIKNWTCVRVDNVIRGNSISRAYDFKDNYRIEYGAGMIYDILSENNYTDENTSVFIKLYQNP